ncbi:MAG: hypothetical protein RLZZ76_688, partial [Candidatus Parcubacteria bacterium]
RSVTRAILPVILFICLLNIQIVAAPVLLFLKESGEELYLLPPLKHI